MRRLDGQRDLHVEARAELVQLRRLGDQSRHVGRVEVGIHAKRDLLRRCDEARGVDLAQDTVAMRHLDRQQQLGVEAEAIGRRPLLRLGVPDGEVGRQRQLQPFQLAPGLQRGHAVDRMRTAQLDDEVQQRILDPAVRQRVSGGVAAFGSRIVLDRYVRLGLDTCSATASEVCGFTAGCTSSRGSMRRGATLCTATEGRGACASGSPTPWRIAASIRTRVRRSCHFP